MREVMAIGDAVIQSVKSFVSRSIESISGRLDEMEKAIQNIPAGAPGKDGVDGEHGDNGRDGTSVTIEDVLPSILEHVERVTADAVTKAMRSIALPKDGAPGRDAAQIEVLADILADKSYPRGTYARYKGGLWRAYEQTNNGRGWECIVEGISDLRIEQEGDRGFKAIAELSSGRIEEKSIALPVQIYRGIFAPGDYQVGDVVTWGGSMWHCDEATNDKPGEPTSKGWRLAVKRGRDGKDGRNGIDVTKAVKI